MNMALAIHTSNTQFGAMGIYPKLSRPQLNCASANFLQLENQLVTQFVKRNKPNKTATTTKKTTTAATKTIIILDRYVTKGNNYHLFDSARRVINLSPSPHKHTLVLFNRQIHAIVGIVMLLFIIMQVCDDILSPSHRHHSNKFRFTSIRHAT